MSSEFGTSDNAVKIPKFDGTNYQLFKSKLTAILSLKGCGEALLPSFKTKLPATEAATCSATTDEGKGHTIAKQQNAMSVLYLTLAMEDEYLMAVIDESRTTDWPGALACEVMASLDEEYKSNDIMARADLQAKMMRLKLGKNENPKMLGDKMTALASGCGCAVDEDTKIAVVVNAAGRHFAGTIQQERKHLKMSGETVTERKLIKAMQEEC